MMTGMADLQHDQFWMSLAERIVAVCAACYVLWGFAIRWVEPGAYDPWALRFGVSGYMVAVWGLMRALNGDRRIIDPLLTISACLVQGHYCYIFYRNGLNPNWFAGAFITIVAAASCLLTSVQLAGYSLFVLGSSLILAFALPALAHSSFLPGVATTLLAVNVAMRGRMRWQEEHVEAERARVKARAAEDALRVRDEYMAIISHELKTPVTSIKLRTQMMLRKLSAQGCDAVPQERVQRFAQETDTQASRLASLVDDMLDLSRMTNGRLPLRHEPMSFSEVVEASLRSLEDAFANAGCVLHACIQPNVMLEGDRRRMEQVVLNLLTNAIKYGRGTPVHVDLESDGVDVALHVSDGGLGVAKYDHARIFERFERAISARHVSGLGLGLFICKEIVSAHDGSITLESDVGKGARFTVTLPAYAAQIISTAADYSCLPPTDHP